jgi:hypothetical protein
MARAWPMLRFASQSTMPVMMKTIPAITASTVTSLVGAGVTPENGGYSWNGSGVPAPERMMPQ